LVVGKAEQPDIMPDYKVDERMWEGYRRVWEDYRRRAWEGYRQVAVDTGLLATRTAFVQSGEGCRGFGEEKVMLGLREMADTDAGILTTPGFLSQVRCELGSEGFELPGCS
jgi:hypothetical protein